jgi:hypothetical protein
LKVDRHVRVAGQERDGDLRQGFVQADGVDLEVFKFVGAMD